MDFYVRLGMGLPLCMPPNLNVPFGYIRDENNPEVCWPIEREIHCLRKAYELLDSGCSYRETARWIMQNTQQRMSEGNLYNLHKYRRPCFKEAALDYEERYRLYSTTHSETKAAESINKASRQKEVEEHKKARGEEGSPDCS